MIDRTLHFSPGIQHQVSGYALGRRSPKNAPALTLNFTHRGLAKPATVDHLVRSGLSFGLYENDQYGDCGPTSAANLVRLVTSWLGTYFAPSQDGVFDLYRRSGNPQFDPTTDTDDNGVDMQTMLEAMLAGGLDGKKPVAFAKVDASNLDDVRAAIAIFGTVLFGVDLKVAQQTQTGQGVWDYVPRSGEWGGHAVMAGQYIDPGTGKADRIGVISWGGTVEVTDAFLQHQLQEVWVLILPEHLQTASFMLGVDGVQLAADYKALTGKTLIVPTPTPAPQPSPTPAPAPIPAPEGFSAALGAFLDDVEAAAAKLRTWITSL